MRPFRLIRKEGFAELNRAKVKKYYISLQENGALEASVVPRAVEPPLKAANPEMTSIGEILPASLNLVPNSDASQYHERKRLEEGRKKVKEKIKAFSVNPRAQEALEEYVCERFKRPFEELTVSELLRLWHEIGEEPTVRTELLRSIKGKS